MQINRALLERIQGRAILKPINPLRLNISQKKVPYIKISTYVQKKNPLYSTIINRFKMGMSEVSSDYLQLLSYFFQATKARAQVSQAVVYKEKYLKAKEAQKISESLFAKQEKKYENSISLLEREYLRLKTEYVLQTKTLLTHEEVEKELVKELKEISVLRVSELELRIEKLYLQKASKEANPFGPKQIAKLIAISTNTLEKKELLGLYREFEQLQTLQAKEPERKDIERLEEKIFTRIQTVMLASKGKKEGPAKVSLLSAKPEAKARLGIMKAREPQTVHLDTRQLQEGVSQTSLLPSSYRLQEDEGKQSREGQPRLLDKFFPLIAQENMPPYEMVQSLLSLRGVRRIAEKEFLLRWKRENKTTKLLHEYTRAVGGEKEKKLQGLKESLYRIKIEQIRSEKPFEMISPAQRKHITKAMDAKLTKLLNQNVDLLEIKTQSVLALLDTSKSEKLETLLNQALERREKSAAAKEIKERVLAQNISTIISQEMEDNAPMRLISAKEKQLLHRKVLEYVLGQKESSTITLEAIREIQKIYLHKQLKKELIFQRSLQSPEQTTAIAEKEKTYRYFLQSIRAESPLLLLSAAQKNELNKKINSVFKRRQKLSELDLAKVKEELVIHLSQTASGRFQDQISSRSKERLGLLSKAKLSSLMKRKKGLSTSDFEPVVIPKYTDQEEALEHLSYEGKQLQKDNAFIQTPRHQVDEYELGETKEALRHISARGRSEKMKSEPFEMLHIGVDTKRKYKIEQKKVETTQYISKRVVEKKREIEQHYSRVIENMDVRLDELASKIFKEIKDEINIEYRRL